MNSWQINIYEMLKRIPTISAAAAAADDDDDDDDNNNNNEGMSAIPLMPSLLCMKICCTKHPYCSQNSPG